ncbi:hypothetical protein DV515_00001390 [Chloebia gouldiae]|uniref:Uncharacterized protein n=1 Tax=Chloebia gouldiae TaxID=44316 RepID=A0A3L8SY03_CHLGU|nr:hypothetical protein DV515_00001390 [Chloebia gouldiae]
MAVQPGVLRSSHAAGERRQRSEPGRALVADRGSLYISERFCCSLLWCPISTATRGFSGPSEHLSSLILAPASRFCGRICMISTNPITPYTWRNERRGKASWSPDFSNRVNSPMCV